MAFLTTSASASRVVPGPLPSRFRCCIRLRRLWRRDAGLGAREPHLQVRRLLARAAARKFGPAFASRMLPYPPVTQSSGLRALEVTHVSCTAKLRFACFQPNQLLAAVGSCQTLTAAGRSRPSTL